MVARVTPLHDAIYRITTPFGGTGTVFLHLLKGDRIALVDTGSTFSPDEVLRPALAELGLALSDVDVILNTHAHIDHAGGNLEVRRVSGARIHMHSAELPMAQSTEYQMEAWTSSMRVLGVPDEAVRARAEHVRTEAGEPAGIDVMLSDGDAIDLGKGIRLRVVHIPGHTPGCVAYYWESEGVIFTGDAVQGYGPRPGAYPFYFDAPSYRRSLARMAELDLRLLGMSHTYLGGSAINGPTREGEECRASLEASMQAADTIHRGVSAVLKRMPGASKGEIARAAVLELIHDIPTLILRDWGLPLLAPPTLLTHIEAAMAGTYPE